MNKLYRLVTALLLASAASALGKAPQGETPKKSPTKSTAPAKKSGAARSPFDKALLTPAALKEKAPDTYEVKFTTTKGDFTLRVTRAWAPLGADRFYNLVKHRFF